MLQNKNAVIYAGGGSIGGAVAKALAREGARVYLTGPHIEPLKKVAESILAAGGRAETALVDALDEQSVNRFIDEMVQKEGTIDISFNAVDTKSVQGAPLVNMTLKDFMLPVGISMRTHFITATATGKVMIRQGSGVILSITATPAGVAYPNVGGFGPACYAVEGFCRGLASELGPHGVRVVNIRSAGSPDSRPFLEALNGAEGNRQFIKELEADTMLKSLPLIDDIAQVAVFLASDMAAKITGTTIDVTCGTGGINYRTVEIPFIRE